MTTTGQILRDARAKRSMSLAEIASLTRIPLASLDALENGRFEALPGPVFARGFLKTYAQAVGTDPAPLLHHYHCESHPCPEPSLRANSRVSTAKNNTSRRKAFGTAFACVVLLVLFGVAFSVVMQPRMADAAVELS